MATAQQVMVTACQEIGYTRWDDPEEGSKYGRDYATRNGAYFGATGVPFCAMFVTWCFRQWGDTPPGGDFAYVPHVIQRAAASGQLVEKTSAQFGDIICYDWDGDGVADHVGFVYENLGSYVQTVEGNTSSGNAGSQSNGGGVYSRARDWSDVCAVVRPHYSDSPAGSAAPAASSIGQDETPDDASAIVATGYGVLAEDGEWGAATEARLARVMNAFGMPKEFSYANVQRFLNSMVPVESIRQLVGYDQLEVDGSWGSDTSKVCQYWMWCWVPGIDQGETVWRRFAPDWSFNDFVDGDWGAASTAVFQAALNRSWGNSGMLMIEPGH
jgi:endolysin